MDAPAATSASAPARARLARPPATRPAPPEPDFGPSVRVFGPGTPAAEIEEAVEAAASAPGGDPASADGHRAVLLKPGSYRVDARIDPRTRVAGLGLAPQDVTLGGALRPADGPRPDSGAAVPAVLWRPVENLVAPGGRVLGGGDKPYLYVDAAGAYRVFLPALRDGGAGSPRIGRAAHGWSVPIDRFFVARPGDSARALNRALAQGRHLLLTPGVYRLADTVRVKWAGTVVLGLGCATLAPVGGTVPMTVADARGVRIAGLLFDAGQGTSPVLLEVGRSAGGRSDPREPASVQDVFFRIGGAEEGRSATALLVHSDHVRLDRVWAWHTGQGADWTAGDGTGHATGDEAGGGCASGARDHPGVRFHDLPAVPAGQA
ncbi:hypothetical protein [Streptomyces sp. NPDC020917]|uniref:hypothetical protein n=1 Tax=Streptomyces sp. NPDC020917 TaxID=3365102 RepID=UPI0037BD0477